MLTDETPAIYLKRRRAAKHYFEQVPESLVELSLVVTGDNNSRFLRACGLEEAKACDVTACLLGWLYTWPLYRAWGKLNRRPVYTNALSICQFLGLPVDGRLPYEFPFGARDSPNDSDKILRRRGDSDKTIALRRLDWLIEEAKTIARLHE